MTSNSDQSFDEKASSLEERIGYQFVNKKLLRQSFIHKSQYNENRNSSCGHNECFEFLGDSVLDLALSDLLMSQFPEISEGELSKVRASLVNEAVLADVAKELKMDIILQLGKGEEQTGGRKKPRLLASVFEAFVGALYRDAGFIKAMEFVSVIFKDRILSVDLSHQFAMDYKTRLQEKVQDVLQQTPVYSVVREEGPDHLKMFIVEVQVNSKVIASGRGSSKKIASQQAAKAALEVV